MQQSEKTSLVKKYRVDIIVIAALLLLSFGILAVTVLTRKEGAYAQVEINGAVVEKYALSVDGVYSLNGGTNTLTIRNGEAYMTYSDCPDHTCENTGKIKYAGQAIVCLPNRLSITIVDASDNPVDFVS